MFEEVKLWANDWPLYFDPISEEQPSGPPLRYEPSFDQIKEARRADDPALSQGVWETELKEADWPAVERLCHDALTTQSKDLQIAIWLMEAWMYQHSFAGVATGLALVNGLCEQFWESIHPQLTDAGSEARLAPLRWLNEKLSHSLAQLPITSGQGREQPAYCWADWDKAMRLARQKGQAKSREDEAAEVVTQALFRDRVQQTATPFYESLVVELTQSLDALATLKSTLDSLCGDEAPSLAKFEEQLVLIQQMARNSLRERVAEGQASEMDGWIEGEADLPHADRDEASSLALAGKPPPNPATHIRNRTDAYQRLDQIADYLMQIEPHSPAPFLIKRAVSWGNLSLAELLQELVHDQRDLLSIYSLLGMENREEEDY